ncbi:DUF3291 domain-containing protein [Phenylobacterium sp.]|jgi:hypothetical protein|uniref:DUF3291 domain-containing protein n=1 Tax=Phenylobacterium sp. TaxID=1871053 RepID=UPI002E2EDB31|nr:DUF3291 domain-containing protein [Phenylobacterium sp.]HEX4711595.1 DUF3291 domain-containing protein [Phenylobacterium sp.]
MNSFHLAEINIGRFRAPVSDPMIADFVANLDRINALADGSPGFIWRLTGEGNNATDIQPDANDPLMALNMSVWESSQALGAFVYRSDHLTVMRRRAEWFEKMELYMALWWVPAGHIPTVEEGMAKVETLRRMGPTAEAFTFRDPFPAPDAIEAPQPVLDECA